VSRLAAHSSAWLAEGDIGAARRTFGGQTLVSVAMDGTILWMGRHYMYLYMYVNLEIYLVPSGGDHGGDALGR
jgi:hypothetical protein